MQSRSSASWSELLWGRNGLRSLALAGGVAVHAVNVYIATTILPSVVEDIGGLEYYAWNTTLFVAASIMGSAFSPKMLDSWGLKRAFQSTLLLFALATAACAMAPSMPWLLAGRTVQGLGGGLLLGLCYSAVRLVFEERLWALAMAFVSSMWGVATLAGPAIGGIFAETGHWRLAFWTVIPIAGGLAWLVHTQLGARGGEPGRSVSAPLDRIGLLVVSVLLVSMGSLSPRLGWNVAGIAAGVAVAVTLARMDKRATTRLLPTGSYALGASLGSLYACIGLLSIGVTPEIFIPYFLQTIHGYTPLVAGYLTALLSAGWTTGSLISSNRSDATKSRLILAGPVLSAISLAALAIVIPHGERLSVGLTWPLTICLVGVGMGVGVSWPHVLTRVFKAAPAGQESVASAAITTLQLYAMALGASVAGIVVNLAGFIEPGGVEGARRAATALFVVFALAPAVAAVAAVGARRVKGV